MRGKIFGIIGSFLLISSALGAATLSYFVIHDDLRVVRVISNSMAPKFHRGDLVVVKPVPTTNLKNGDIAVLPLVDGSGGFYMHRIIEIRQTLDGSVVARTKGDANPIADRWQLEITSEKVPVYQTQIATSALPIVAANKYLIFGLFALLVIIIGSIFLPSRSEKSKLNSKLKSKLKSKSDSD